MPGTVADLIVRRLRDWGVDRLFGYPGDGINGVMGALQRSADGPELIQARHEEMAAFMACAHAKYTGGLGVVVATQGPGAIHLLNGLYDAKLDHKPVLAIVGQQVRSALGSTYQQEIDLLSLFKDVCAEFVQQASTPEQFPMLVDRAVRIAFATRGPTCLIIPHDVQNAEQPDLPARAHGIVPGSGTLGWEPARPVPPDAQLDAAAAVLNEGHRVAILIGQGAATAVDEVIDVADRLGAGVAKALLGKPVLADDLPFVTGVLGHLGTTASWELMSHCDTLLMIGTNEPWTEYLPPAGAARAVQIDIDGRNLGYRYPTEVNLLGDAKATLEALLPRLQVKVDREWRTRVVGWVEQWHREREARARQHDVGADRHEGATAVPHRRGALNPQLVFQELSERLPDDALLAVDVGSSTYWYARDVQLRGAMQAHLSSTLASMGSALPYGIAAKLAFPDRPVICLAGDGAMQMNGINELITVSRLWHRWADPRFAVLVVHNNDLAEVTWEMREMEGNPRWADSQDLPDFPYAAYAALLGFTAQRVDAPGAVGPAWDAALAADRPVLIEAICDADMPLLPPHLEADKSDNLFAGLDGEGAPGVRARNLVVAQSFNSPEPD